MQLSAYLLERKYVVSMKTPIVRVMSSNKKKGDLLFYSLNQFREFGERHKGCKHKYYKGLGSSSKKDILETFGRKTLGFELDDNSSTSMDKVFSKDFTNTRKVWLTTYDSTKDIRWDTLNSVEHQYITVSDYLDTETIKFSIDDCSRSLPNGIDGLKESQRKILYAVFLKNLKHTGETLKVAQLAGYVSEKTEYLHGEQNLWSTIIGMAQNFVGSNNIPLLDRDGSFGSRLSLGKDAANARYIFTKLEEVTRLIYPSIDDDLLERIEDEGRLIEPYRYVPIIPMILVNGVTAGIGTGWSSSVPSHNPLSIIRYIEVMLSGKKPTKNIKPFYNNFEGVISDMEDGKYMSYGVVKEIKSRKRNSRTYKVTEIPIGASVDSFKEFLDGLCDKK